MHKTLEDAAQSVSSPGRDWQPLADRLAAALATLEEDRNLTDGS